MEFVFSLNASTKDCYTQVTSLNHLKGDYQMEITWLGHSSVCINSRDEILITDPFDTSHSGMMPSKKSNIVTVSNDDPKYSTTKALDGDPYIINGPGEYEIGQYYITGMATAIAGSTDDETRRTNVVYSIRAEGLVICQLGGLNQKLTSSQLDQLRQANILLAPIANNSALDHENLQEIINAIQPRILIPLEYIEENNGDAPTGLEKFLTNTGSTETTGINRLNIDETKLPAEMKIQILNPQSS